MKRLLSVYILFFCLVLGNVQAQKNPQSDEITQRFFPEWEYPISTPAFAKKDGFTTHTEMMAWLDAILKKAQKRASMRIIGQSQKGKDIPLLLLTAPNGNPKTKVWMQGGLHGDEAAGTEAMLYLIDRLVKDSSLTYLLNSLEIAIVPMANIDGYEAHNRFAADGQDLNRDQTRLKAPESVALKAAFSKFQPAVALDFHEYRPYRKEFRTFGKNGITTVHDAMFLYSGNLNVPKNLRDYTANTFVANARKVLDQNKLRHYHYFTTEKYGGHVGLNIGSVHARSSASNFALANTVSTLLEIRGIGLGRTSFKRRVKTAYLIALSYLETAVKEQENLKRVLAEAAKQQNKVVVISERKEYKDTVPVIDLSNNQEIKMEFSLHNALFSKATLTRSRPFAYIIDKSERRAAKCLKLLGLQLDSLEKDTELKVEAYKQSVLDEDEGSSEEEESGKAGPNASTETITRNFTKGCWIVYTNQERANLACEVLEPENPNGFVAMKVIKPKTGQLLPVYRYLNTEKIKP